MGAAELTVWHGGLVDPSTEQALATAVAVDPSTADGGSGRVAVELTSLATVVAVHPS